MLTSDKNIICRYCSSQNVRKYGKVEGIQRYFCNDCRHKFSDNDCLYRMKTPYYQVSSALEAYYQGQSINDIRNNLRWCYGNYPSGKAVYGWIIKYSQIAIDRFKDYQPHAGPIWATFLSEIKVDGKPYRCLDILGCKTGFLLASGRSLDQRDNMVDRIMKYASQKAGKDPERVLTGGGKGEDLRIARRWSSILQERTKVLNGLKSIEAADRFLEGFLTYYNFLRPHDLLHGRTPAEAASIRYSANTWMDVILMAAPRLRVYTADSIHKQT
jgi:hypothetical protein